MDNPTTAMQLALIANIPVILWDQPGTGKTTITAQIAAELPRPDGGKGWIFRAPPLSAMDPADVVGVPMPEVLPNGRAVQRHAIPSWAYDLSVEVLGNKPGLLFLDEFSTAPPSVQAVALRILYERTVGECRLGPNVRIILAANPADTTTGAYELTSPAANRMVHINWSVDIKYWARALRQDFPCPEIIQPEDNWQENIPHWANLVATFAEVRSELIQSQPKGDDERGRAWPSRRTWHMAVHALAIAQSHGEDVQAELVTGLVGTGPGFEFFTWLRNLDLPRSEDVLADPTIVKAPGEGQDHRLYAIMSGVIHTVRRSMDAGSWQGACKVLVHINQFSPDLVLPFVHDLFDLKLAIEPQGTPCIPPQEAQELFGKLAKDSGLLASPTVTSS